MRAIAICLLLGAGSAWAAEPPAVEATRSFTHPKLQMTVVGGEVNLPAEGIWQTVQPASTSPLSSVYLLPPPMKQGENRSKVMEMAQRQQQIEHGRWQTQQLYPLIQEYALKNNGVGPASLDALFKDAKDRAYMQEALRRSPWPEDQSANLQGPFFFVIPETPLPDPTPRPPRPEEARPLVLELRPYVGDGQHWVLFTDGRCERVEIAQDLVKKYNLTITTVVSPTVEALAPVAETQRYGIVALRRGEFKEAVGIVLRNAVTDQAITLAWDPRKGSPADAELVTQWARARLLSWAPLLRQADSTVLRVWLARHAQLYDLQGAVAEAMGTENWPGDRTINLFQVLGGRAAIRETLQMQAIGTRQGGNAEPETVPIDTIAGVQVKSHTFAELLKGESGGRLPLADAVPPDRFFAYFAKPAALVAYLEGGSDFLAHAGAFISRSRVDDDLEGKFLARLGLNGKWGREFLRHGAVTEIGVVLPDVFLLDGTELTVLLRVPQMGLAQPLLRLLGIPKLEQDKPTPVPLPGGETAYWAVRGDLLLASTHPQELERVLRLHQAGGQGSLGQSAEFRYMLTRLPLQPTTTAYAYLSDAFIRQLVGPQTKIAQVRRLRARADLQVITAGALLYQADGQPGTPSLTKLAELGYVPAALALPDYALQDDGVALSKRYGTLAKPASLLVNPVVRATAAEAEAYKRYLDDYSRFWRQFFDPIALRLDEAGSGGFEISTFILPLLESQLYDQVRAVVATAETGKPLRVPALARQPVLMLSLNLRQESWVQVARNLAGLFGHYSGLDPQLLDYLGPSVHLAIADSDPIIALGSGDLLDAFGGGPAALQGSEMFFLPAALSVFTRPTTLVVELTDPRQVLAILKQAEIAAADPRRRRFNMSLRRIAGRDAWVYTVDVVNVIALNFGLEVQGDHLIITNLPWTQRSRLTAVAPTALNGALLQVNPGAAEQQLPALYASAVIQEQATAMQGIGYLYPLLLGGGKSPDEAAALHARLFGFRPLHPGSGQWLWRDGVLASSVFGTPERPQQPEYSPGARAFGLFREDLDRIGVNMQFEEAGLRTSVRWSLRQP